MIISAIIIWSNYLKFVIIIAVFKRFYLFFSGQDGGGRYKDNSGAVHL